jgi:hypothetical protein
MYPASSFWWFQNKSHPQAFGKDCHVIASENIDVAGSLKICKMIENADY